MHAESALTQRLLGWMAALLEDPARVARVDAALCHDLEDELFTSVLSADERPLAAQWRASQSEAIAHEFVAQRVERAVRAALVRIFAPDAPPATPRILVQGSTPAPLVPEGGRALLVLCRDASQLELRSGAHANAVGCIERLEVGGSLERMCALLDEARLASSRGTSRTLGSAAHGDPESLVGALLGKKYLLTRCLGTGGFGCVYEGRDLQLDKAVAIKILNPERARNPAELRALREEAKRVTRIRHPHIVEWKAFDETEDGTCYFVMELLRGRSLREAIDRERAFPPRWVERRLEQMLAALQGAHEQAEGEPILHLDLKPQNILLIDDALGGEPDFVKIIDFGAGHLRQAGEARAVAASEADTATACTRAGTAGDSSAATSGVATACTPEYAAPELCAHMLAGPRPVLDGRADLYSVGVIGYELLTGRLPIEVPPDRHDLLELKQHLDLPPVSETAAIPKALGRFLDRCLARDPARRWASATAALEALRRIVRWRRRRNAACIGAPALALATSLAWWWLPSPRLRELSVLRMDAGALRPLEGRVYFGPRRTSASLRLEGLEEGESASAVSLVSSRERGAAPISGSRVIAGRDGIELRWSRAEDRFESPAYLRAELADGEALFSPAFEVVWLGANALALQDLRLPCDDAHALDPTDRSALLVLRGRAEDVDSAWIAVDGRRLEAVPEASPAGASSTTFVAPLTRAFPRSGAWEITGAVQDRAGRTVSTSRVQAIVMEPLRVRTAALDCVRIGEAYSLPVDGAVQLELELSRSARVTWQLRASDGRALADGALDDFVSGHVPLGALALAQEGRSYSGELRIEADDGGTVARGHAERGHASLRLPVEFVAGEPRLRAELQGSAHAPIALDSLDAGPLYWSGAALALRVQRASEHVVRVEAEFAPAGRPELRTLRTAEMLDPLHTEELFDLGTPPEGAYRLVVRAWRMSREGVAETGAPDVSLQALVVVDRTAPVLALDAPEGRVVLHALGSEPAVTLRSRAPAVERDAAPVDLGWRLRERDRPGAWLDEGEIADARDPVALRLPPAWPSSTPPADGAYELVVTARDRAGNAGAPLAIPFELSTEGPAITPLEPLPGVRWILSRANRLAVSAQLDDRNGVEGALVRVRASDGGAEAPLRAEQGVWRAELEPRGAWADEVVEVELVARDRCGTESRLATRAEIVRADLSAPPVVAAALGSGPVARMHLVRGNADFPYRFGGRSDEEENRLFEEAGLAPFNDLSLARSWAVAYPEGAIPDFYLDEREVTVARFLAFATERGAWARADLWGDAGEPGEARRLELVAELGRSDADEPATGMTWREANAYARALGLRLPSLVEWEYAVRGGAKYRPYAGYSGRGDERGARAGADETSDSGIVGLCTGATEWTASPLFADGALPANLGEHMAGVAALVLHPWTRASWEREARFWIAGDSARAADFTSIASEPSSWHDHALGFRCALPAETVLAVLDRPAGPGLNLTSVDDRNR